MRASGIIACVFDFDDTLAPDSTSALLESRGIPPTEFWESARGLVAGGYDQTLAWLRLLLDNIGDGRPLGPLSSADLREFGSTLDGRLFPGLDAGFFADLREAAATGKDVSVEFYIVSGGLRDVLVGSEFVSRHFTAVYGTELDEDADGVLRHIKRAVSFTEKTRYLFEINKGIDIEDSSRNPYLVNQAVAPDDRRVPFTNMIYVGDGLTDIPCFSLLDQAGGTALGVFDQSDESKAKRAVKEFLGPKRVRSLHFPRYGRGDELGAILRAAVSNIAGRIVLQRTEAYG